VEFGGGGFCEGKKIGEPGEKPSEEGIFSNKLNTHMIPGRNRNRATLVEGESSRYCAIPGSQVRSQNGWT